MKAGLAGIDSFELSEWHAILTVEDEERVAADKDAKSKAKADDKAGGDGKLPAPRATLGGA